MGRNCDLLNVVSPTAVAVGNNLALASGENPFNEQNSTAPGSYLAETGHSAAVLSLKFELYPAEFLPYAAFVNLWTTLSTYSARVV
ncbi:hypothetical protein NSU18_14135 [Paenibacillus sp. FSL H8-0048]|uniref:hypothetical protein n=1 Tax=Paenibacillus sp. FSL H8-0048 TaxID=2954508 RepID=UPI0030F8ED56